MNGKASNFPPKDTRFPAGNHPFLNAYEAPSAQDVSVPIGVHVLLLVNYLSCSQASR
jgi:hypothetical protein